MEKPADAPKTARARALLEALRRPLTGGASHGRIVETETGLVWAMGALEVGYERERDELVLRAGFGPGLRASPARRRQLPELRAWAAPHLGEATLDYATLRGRPRTKGRRFDELVVVEVLRAARRSEDSLRQAIRVLHERVVAIGTALSA